MFVLGRLFPTLVSGFVCKWAEMTHIFPTSPHPTVLKPPTPRMHLCTVSKTAEIWLTRNNQNNSTSHRRWIYRSDKQQVFKIVVWAIVRAMSPTNKETSTLTRNEVYKVTTQSILWESNHSLSKANRLFCFWGVCCETNQSSTLDHCIQISQYTLNIYIHYIRHWLHCALGAEHWRDWATLGKNKPRMQQCVRSNCTLTERFDFSLLK